MSKRTYLILCTAIIISLITLISMPEICVSGARYGLILWFDSIIPTLFPFFVITRLIIELNLCPKRLLPYYPVLIGLLSGYPNGALTIGELVKRGQISVHKGQYLLVICNNASPVFLISFIGFICLNNVWGKYVIWLCVIAASFITYMLIYKKDGAINIKNTKEPAEIPAGSVSLHCIFEQIIMKSFEVLVMVGAYIILFSIIAHIIMTLNIPEICTIITAGILEITTGMNLLSDASLSDMYKYIIAAGICGFGGMSAILQSKGVICASGLSITKYILHKIICTVISCILCYIYIMIRVHL